MSAEEDLARHVAAALGDEFTYGENVRVGPVVMADAPVDGPPIPGAVPHQCLFFLGTGGLDDVPFADGGAGTSEGRITVQVWVRSEPLVYEATKALADRVFDVTNMNPPSGYFECRALGGAPLYIRRDEKQHHEWTVNVLMKTCP